MNIVKCFTEMAAAYQGEVMGGAGRLAEVQAMMTSGLPEFRIYREVGSAQKDVIRCALMASGYQFPNMKVVVQVVGDKRDEGVYYTAENELAIAAAILAASGQVDPGRVEGKRFDGSLKLDGTVYTCVKHRENELVGKTLREIFG